MCRLFIVALVVFGGVLQAQPPMQDILADIDTNFVFVEGGTFERGCDKYDTDCNMGAKPKHEVTVSTFEISKYEVTQMQWVAVMSSNPSEKPWCENCPVNQVTWDDIQIFLHRLDSISGIRYRLPTEAEWEFAAIGGVHSNGYQFSGSNDIEQVAWYYGTSTHKVKERGLKKPNELGLCDMTGNVSEWCSDIYDLTYYSYSPKVDPKGAASGDSRAKRGGCFYNMWRSCLNRNRSGYGSWATRRGFGFRLARKPR